MRNLTERTEKGYDIEISIDHAGEIFYADIKYPCGELAQGLECETTEEAENMISAWLKNAPEAFHIGCVDEYCIGEK